MFVKSLKFAGLFSFLLVIMASCDKNDNNPITDKCTTKDTTVFGDWAVPPTGNFGIRYSYLGNADKTNKVSLSGTFNGDLKAENGWSLGYISSHQGALCTISPSVKDSSVSVLGFETGSATGWYSYASRKVTPIPGRVAILRKASSNDVYAVRLESVDTEQNTPSNPAQYRGKVKISFAKIR